jgi:hypothetical protein
MAKLTASPVSVARLRYPGRLHGARMSPRLEADGSHGEDGPRGLSTNVAVAITATRLFVDLPDSDTVELEWLKGGVASTSPPCDCCRSR